MTPRLSSRFGFFFFKAEEGMRDSSVTGVQTCALPIGARDYFLPASRKKIIAGAVMARPPSSVEPHDSQARQHDIGQGQRKQDFPSYRHQLVIAKSRQRPPQPHVEKQKQRNLQ